MKKYVLGFAFSKNKKEIVLIEKLRPEWQKGKLNGVGGKVEEFEAPIFAMCREFKEETGVETFSDQWHHFASMIFNEDIMGGGAIVYVFRMVDDVVQDCVTIEDEEIVRVNVDTVLDSFSCMHNLPILIPLALSDEFEYTEFRQKLAPKRKD